MTASEIVTLTQLKKLMIARETVALTQLQPFMTASETMCCNSVTTTYDS